MAKKIVAVDNKILTAQYKLTDLENRLVWFLVGEVQEDGDEFKACSFTPSELCRAISMDVRNSHKLGAMLDNISRIFIRIDTSTPTREQWSLFPWFNKTTYTQGEEFTVQFNGNLKPYLLDLKEKFTKLGLQSMMEITGDHARRIYMDAKQQAERIKQGYHDQRVKDYSIDEYREKIKLGKSYNVFKDFKRYVLDKAEKEINEKSDIRISIVPTLATRVRKKYQHFTITILSVDGKEVLAMSPQQPKPKKSPRAEKYKTPTRWSFEYTEQARAKVKREIDQYVAKRFSELGENEQDERLIMAEAQLDLFPKLSESPEVKAHREYRDELMARRDPRLVALDAKLKKYFHVEDHITYEAIKNG